MLQEKSYKILKHFFPSSSNTVMTVVLWPTVSVLRPKPAQTGALSEVIMDEDSAKKLYDGDVDTVYKILTSKV